MGRVNGLLTCQMLTAPELSEFSLWFGQSVSKFILSLLDQYFPHYFLPGCRHWKNALEI